MTKADAQHPDLKLPGVTFQCSADPSFDPAKAAVLEQTTGTDGTTTFEHLTPGQTYYVREIQQAAGYDIDVTDVQSVTVVDQGRAPPGIHATTSLETS